MKPAVPEVGRMEDAVPETLENRPVWPVRPFARRTAPFALIFESLEIVNRVCPTRRGHWLGCGHWPFSAWMPVADVEGARNRHWQTAVGRFLKNRGRVFCRSGAVRIHTPTIDNCITEACSEWHKRVTHFVESMRPRQGRRNDRA